MATSTRTNPRLLDAAVVLSGFSALGFEIYLSRVFSFLFTDGLLYFPISIAFLGMGAAGVSLYFSKLPAREEAAGALRRAVHWQAFFCALFLVVSLAMAQGNTPYRWGLLSLLGVTLKASSLLRQLDSAYFLPVLLGLLAGVPFFFAGRFLSLGLTLFSERADRLYFCDLAGAALGCLGGVLLLQFFGPVSLDLAVIIALGGASLLLRIYGGGPPLSKAERGGALVMLAAAVMFPGIFGRQVDYRVDPNLAARDYGHKSNVHQLWQGWNAYSQVVLLSVNKWQHLFAINRGISHATLTPFKPDDPFKIRLDMNRWTPLRLGFALGVPKDLLILFAGAGDDMIRAYGSSEGRSNITGVEINPLIVNKAMAMRRFHLREFFSLPNVKMVVEEGRSFLNRDKGRYDSIVLSFSGAPAAYFRGSVGPLSQYLYTKEAFVQYWEHLKPGGTLAVVNGNKMKILAMAKAAHEASYGVGIEGSVVMTAAAGDLDSQPDFAASWEGRQVLFKKGGFTRKDVDSLESQMRQMGRGVVYSPFGCHPAYAIYKDMLLSRDLEGFLGELSRRSGRNFALPTDDRPFIFNMARPQVFLRPSYWKYIGRHPYVEDMAFRQLVATGFIAVLLAAAMGVLGLPLILKSSGISLGRDLPYLWYFSTIGLGFICGEIYLIQALGLFLGHPIFALAHILALLLVASGVGSFYSRKVLGLPAVGLSGLALLASVALLGACALAQRLNASWLNLATPLKLTLSAGLIFPLGFLLGVFFPAGVEVLRRRRPALIPYAYGVNHLMSILGSLSSILVAQYWGFRVLALAAAGCYLSLALLCRSKSFRAA